jgi:hypothetical protein
VLAQLPRAAKVERDVGTATALFRRIPEQLHTKR